MERPVGPADDFRREIGEGLAAQRVQTGGGKKETVVKVDLQVVEREGRASGLCEVLAHRGVRGRASGGGLRRLRGDRGGLRASASVRARDSARTRASVRARDSGCELQRFACDGTEREVHGRGTGVICVKLLQVLQDGTCSGHVIFAAGTEHVATTPAGEVAVREAGAGENRTQVGGELRVLNAGELVPAGGDGGGNIFGPLHAPLNFEGRYAGRCHFAHVLYEIQVPQREVVPRAAGRLERQPARLRAQPAVAASTSEHGGEIALSGHAHAQCPVHKGLEFHVRMPVDSLHFGECELPRHDSAHKPQLLQFFEAFRGHDRQLGGTVQPNVRNNSPRQSCHRQVLDNKGVHARLRRVLHELQQVAGLVVRDQRVERQIHPYSPKMAVGDSLLQPFAAEVRGVAAGVETAGAQVDRVGPAAYRCRQGLPAAGRRQHLHRTISHHSYLST